MLPEGWSRRPLHEVADVRTGVAKGKTGLTDPVELPYLRVANVQDGFIDLSEVKTIAVERHQIDRYSLQAGDILMTEGGDFDKLGRGAVWSGTIDPCLHQNHVFAVRAKRELVNPLFLSALSGSEYGRTYFLGCAKRSTNLASINSSQLKAFPVLLPPVAEQNQIAHILSTWDQAIATTEHLLANGRMQWNALIGITLHLPSANPDSSAPAENNNFPASVQPGIPTLPPAPPEWRRIQLGDHLKEVRRQAVLTKNETYTLVTVKRSRGGVALREVLQGKEVKTPTQFYVHTDDFLISKRQIVHGACGIVPPALDGAVVSNEYAVLNTDGEIDLQFLRYLSETRYFQQTCFHSSIGVHVEKMIFKVDHWLNWPFNIPPLARQQHIVEILDIASREIAAISKQLKALKREKSALMSQLITGKRRVRLPAGGASTA
ncbi:restriction endonuclease subunit S [Xanthomonas nasturtii]|nr:restriction endonuclease subunit S [Xanthomonas nasturtii]MCL1530824.1 restriction endonuclease subunit S [Xanthomonas nasturtii]MCL1565681.1 restriction endonuclease subunit S [Xanthomonas nasturtii]MCL1569755.1 restriction endonuclease subunit S [Xanthomonas nasturtii]MCL1573533.1 restriction endonuclease subunit S [Xanthomonas nasturtii]MCL1581281.1 restriction endonuclease subunit S [Xanthomonas nasturtii]